MNGHSVILDAFSGFASQGTCAWTARRPRCGRRLTFQIPVFRAVGKGTALVLAALAVFTLATAGAPARAQSRNAVSRHAAVAPHRPVRRDSQTSPVVFSYTGELQSFTVPAGVTSLQVQLWGAGGAGDDTYYAGGGGAYVQGTLSVAPGEQLTILVGGGGKVSDGGFGGGGVGGGPYGDGGGGGRSAILATATGSELVDAAGGGGAGDEGTGGGGGCVEGAAGVTGPFSDAAGGGGGGTQTAGGSGGSASGYGATAGAAGGEYQGGAGAGQNYGGGGGGGGYYGGGGGGGGGGGYDGGGGGGSSYFTDPTFTPTQDLFGAALLDGSQLPGGALAPNYTDGIGVGNADNYAGDGQVVISWPQVTVPQAPITSSPTAFTYTGGPQYFTVPAGVTSVQVQLWGAGGACGDTLAAPGGSGAYIQGTLNVTPGQELTVLVGGGGVSGGPGGYGGGGAAGYSGAGSGGGRSAIVSCLTGNEAVDAAGGGGGGGSSDPSAFGDYTDSAEPGGAGAAGGVAAGGEGAPGGNYLGGGAEGAGYGGGGGTQTAGGMFGGDGGVDQTGGYGSQFLAGSGGDYDFAGGGGGGGYYGGGGGGGGQLDAIDDIDCGSGGGGSGSSYTANAQFALLVGQDGNTWPGLTPAAGYISGVGLGGPGNFPSNLYGGNGEVVISWAPPVPTTLSGTIALEGSVNQAQSLTFQIEPAGGGTISTQTVTPDPSGNYTLTGILPGTYTVGAKGDRWLQTVVQNVTVPAGGAINVNIALIPGDMNGDNVINIEDFAILAAAYGSSTGNSNWNAVADLNCDGVVDINDFSLFAQNYGMSGQSMP